MMYYRNVTKKKRVAVTIDPAIWARCQALTNEIGSSLSWSQVAEYAFVTLVEQIEKLRTQVFANARPGASDEELKALLVAYFTRQIHSIEADAFKQIDEDFANPPLAAKPGPKPKPKDNSQDKLKASKASPASKAFKASKEKPRSPRFPRSPKEKPKDK